MAYPWWWQVELADFGEHLVHQFFLFIDPNEVERHHGLIGLNHGEWINPWTEQVSKQQADIIRLMR